MEIAEAASGGVEDQEPTDETAASEAAVDGAENNAGAAAAVIRIWSQFVVVFRGDCDSVYFRVNRPRSGGLSFTDSRECKTGVAGTTGMWGTRPPMRASRPRSLTPTALKLEVTRLIGRERAEQIAREVTQDVVFANNLPQMQTSQVFDRERG